MKLKNMVLIRDQFNNYRAKGVVYGDDCFADGTLVITPDIEIIDFDMKTIEAETFIYAFDKIDDIKYEEVSLQ